jgi:hypothetical protein
MYCILPTSAAEAVPTQVCNLLGITMLAPFSGLGLCQTETHSLFDTSVGSPQNSSTKADINLPSKAEMKSLENRHKHQNTCIW